MARADRFANALFLGRSPDAERNACIGGQGGKHNYANGHILAANEALHRPLLGLLKAGAKPRPEAP
jgi:hypothetical protein